MRKKFTLLITVTALLLGGSGQVWGQAAETTWWGGYDCAYPTLTIGSNGVGGIYTPNDNAGTRNFSEVGLLINGQASHSWSLGQYHSCTNPNPGDPGASHSTHPLTINITGTAAPYNPLHFKYFQYNQPTWRHTWSWSWYRSDMSCSGSGSDSNSSTGNVSAATIAIQGGAIRLHDVDAIKKLASMTSNLTLPTSYTMKFDALYKGPQGVAVSGNGALTTIGSGQGVGFYAGTTQNITFNGGSILYLGPTSANQSTITVNTSAGAVNIKNYMSWIAGDTDNGIPNTHGVALGAFTAANITVGTGNLNIYNWNQCQSLTFANVMEPTIGGAGNINIYTESQDLRLPAVDSRYGYKSVINGGLIAFNNNAAFDFSSNTGAIQIVGQSVTFDGTYTYKSSASSPLHEISANSVDATRSAIGCGVGDIWFKAAVLVEKEDGNTNWFATQDIKTSVNTAPVSYEISGNSNTMWHAERNVDMRSSVTFEQAAAGTGNITWRAENDILTNHSCSNDNGFGLFDIQGTGDVLLNAFRDIHTKGRVDFAYAGGATGTLSLIADEGNIQAERQLTIDVNEDSNNILISAESPSGITRSPLLGNIYTYDSLRITRHNGGQGTTEVLSQNDIRTAMVDIENTAVSDNDYLIESHMGDIELGYHLINPSVACTNPAASAIDYNLNYFKYTAPGNSTGTLNVYAGFGDTDATKIPWGGGNIRFTRIKETLGNGSNHPTEFKIPFSNWYYCGDATYGAQPYYENAGIIGGVNRCQVVDPTYPCSVIGLDYQGFNGELLFDAGTRGNIIINNGGYLTFQGGNGNAKFLTRWGDIDMRYPFDVDSMKGSLLFLASSQLPNKTQTDLCSCDEIRNNVYLQDFKYNPIQNGGSVFIGADNNIKVQYGGLQSGSWMNNKYDPFFNQTEYPCNSGFIHCDADTAQNQARDLILNFDTLNAGGMAMVASDLIDVYKNMVYTGGKGTGLSSVPGYGSLHGETVAGYGLYIKTQADKNNWNMSDHDINNVPNPEVGAACSRDSCKVDFLHNIARVTFHADARIYAEDQHVFISSPVLDTYGNADYNTHQRSGSKTSILVQADSLIFHDSLIIDGKHTRFTTWSDLKYDMPIIRLGHQRFTPATAEPGCVPCYVHPKDTRNSGGTPFLDTVFVTFRNDANSIGRLQTLVAEHAVISFLTDSFDHAKGNPTLNAKFYTDIFKIRNHVELYKTADHTHDGHFELISEEQMESKDYAGIYSRHLHMEPIAPTCSDFKFSQLWLQEPNLDVITSSTFGGFGWIHANVHVENEANLFPGFASLGTNGNCYEQRAGVLKMQDLRMDKGANVKVSVGDYDAHKSFAEMYECPWTLESIELGRYADCLIVDSLSIQGTLDIDIAIRSGLFLAEGESRCFPIIQYQSVEEGVLNNIHLKKDKLTSDDHKSIEGTYYLTIDADTTCNVVYLCIATVPGPKIMRDVYIPPVSGVTTDPVNGTYRVRSGNNFEFKAKYTTDCPLKVMTGRVIDGDKEEIFGTKNANGEYEYVIQQVRTNITLTIGPDCASENPNANDNVDGEIVWSHNNTIYIKVDREDIASIYSVAGQLIKRVDLPEGTYSTDLERGVYIVTLKDGSVHKVILK